MDADDAWPYFSVTNDNTQFGKALAVCPNAAVPAAQLFLMHHILRYSFAGRGAHSSTYQLNLISF